MKLRYLVPPLAILSCLAVPALAQGYNVYSYNGPAITGAQMSDLPSERSNVTTTGSFLRPEMGNTTVEIYSYRDRHPYRVYREPSDRYDHE